MNLFERAYKELMLEGKVSVNKINLAMDRHRLVVIRYNTHGEQVAMADRLCGIFAYGVTKRGNECIRVFEYKGDTTTFVPGWKLIRLDRIISWRETKKTISSPPTDTGVGEFNPNGDNSMSIVYKVAKFDNIPVSVPQGNEPKTVNNIKGASSKQQQKQNFDYKKVADGLKPYQTNQTTLSNEPKTAQDVKGSKPSKDWNDINNMYANNPLTKTDTEKAIDYLRRQLDNPTKIDLSKYNKNIKPKVQPSTTQTQKPESETPAGLEPQYANVPLKKTDTENAMEYLRKQLENPEKIDLSRIPKK